MAVNRSYAVNALNQYTSAGPATFTYDANANLTSDGTTSYVYDAENRLVGASNGAQLAYDTLGRLFQVSGTATGTTQFLYGGDKLLDEYDGPSNILKRYVHATGEDTPELWFNGAGLNDARFLFADHQGSIVGLLPGAATTMLVNSYDEYGIPGPGNTGRFGYTGQAWLPEVGMWYYKGRIYSPTLGRFLQTDPIGYADQINLYAYVANDPVNHADPKGEATIYYYPNQTVIVQTFDNQSQFSNDQIITQGKNLSGTDTSGRPVTVVLVPNNDADAAHIRTNPSLNDMSSNGADRSHTDRIGGRQINVAPNAAGPVTTGHELGHVIGAGDQYTGGVDAHGNTVTSAPPNSQNTIMRDLGGPANAQTVQEMKTAPTNTQKTCSVNVFESVCE